VESTQKGDTYSRLDPDGRYRVRLDFDRSSSEQGYAYLWLWLAKPYACDIYGSHSPLLDGAEVAVALDLLRFPRQSNSRMNLLKYLRSGAEISHGKGVPVKICYPIRNINGQEFRSLDEVMRLIDGEA